MRRSIRVIGLVAFVALGLVPVSTASAQTAAPTVPLVRIPFPAEDGSLTPYTFQLGYPLVTLIYDTLFWRDASGVDQPWLARSLSTSADGKTLTVHLDDRARWQDGPPVTAADVAFTFTYVATHFHPRFTPELEAVQKVVAVDATTVVVTLKHPSPGFVDQPLADLPIFPEHLWADLPAGQQAPTGLPVGSGPYRLVEHIPGKEYVFQANTGYFKGAPAVQTIEVPIMGDAEQALEALEENNVDMLPFSLPPDQATRFGLGYSLATGPSYFGTVVMFNLRQSPFDRPDVRQALSEALDLDQIDQAVGDAVAASHGYLDPSSPWAPSQTLHVVDESAARAVLSRLTLPPVQVLASGSDPDTVAAAQQVAGAWRQVGVQASATLLDGQALDHAVGEDGSTPTFSVAIWSSPALASYDPDGLRLVFGSNPLESPVNFSGYHSSAFDQLAAKVAVTTDRQARKTAADQELQVLATDLPVIPLFFANGTYAYRPAVYDRWVYVKGTGILDKQSFLTASGPAAIATTTTSGTVAEPSHSGSGFSILGWGAVAAVAAAAIIAVIAVVRR